MNTIIWAKRFWAKLLLVLWLVVAQSAWANVAFNPLYVHLSDALNATKSGQTEAARSHLQALQTALNDASFSPEHQSALRAVEQALNHSLQQTDVAHLGELSKALYALEKTVKPVDYEAKRQQFAKRVLPVYQQLNRAVEAGDVAQALEIYARFNRTWTVNEKTVRDQSLGHYGKIETAMNFLRIALSQTPANLDEAKRQSALLGAALKDFQQGGVLAVEAGEIQTLNQGIELLQSALHDLKQNNNAAAQSALSDFLNAWVIFEGSVRTRDAQLYHDTESALPRFISQINAPETQTELETLIARLQTIDPNAHYGIIDAMLVLLREGLEAMLIMMALLTALRHVAPRASVWVYAGAGAGLLVSVVAAMVLSYALPATIAGTGREILEGTIGIFAVLMMLLVGGWLHSKASIAGWKRFVETRLQQALAQGSFWSLFGLAFLSVFREGAETILFYAGMMPMMQTQDLWLGMASALAILLILALVIWRSSYRLPIPRLFALMSVCIYGLGFKILGVSVHTLQLTQILPRHFIDLPALPLLGWYNTWEGFVAQALFLAMIPVMRKVFK